MRDHERIDGLTPTGRRMAKLVAEHEQSGLSVREFTEQRGISPGSLCWWRWNLRQRGARVAARPVLVEAAVLADVVPSEEPAAHAAIVVDLGLGRRIEVPHGFDEAHFKRVLLAVTSC